MRGYSINRETPTGYIVSTLQAVTTTLDDVSAIALTNPIDATQSIGALAWSAKGDNPQPTKPLPDEVFQNPGHVSSTGAQPRQ